MAGSRKVVQIFLASPGDLQDERRSAKAVVDAFNKKWADWLGIQVELVGWEDTFKRWGRPQEQINLDLDRCEAFIGMLWRRWGMPPNKDGGPYTSGFEEEFERAVASRKKAGRPEMTLFFKKIDPEFLKDKGPDLVKVLSFKERIEAERLILYEQFDALPDFEEKLDGWITRYVQQLKQQETPAASSESPLPASDQPSQASPTPLTVEGAKFVREFVAKTERDRETNPIESVEVARFRLLANMVGTSGNDDGSLAVHDANILFRNRATLALSRREMETLIDSGLDHIANPVVPFWHWYVAAEAHETGYLSIATLAGPQSRRGGALKAMRLIGEPVKPLAPIGSDNDTGIDRKTFIRSWLLPDREEYVKVAALEYLAVCGDTSDLPILNAEFEKRNYQTVAAATDAIIRIHLRQSREQAVQALFTLQPETVDGRLVAAIFAKPASIPTELLLDGMIHRNPKVRSTVVSILAARNALPSDTADKLLDDSEANVRFCALRSLIREGREISNEKARSILVKPAQRTGGGLSGLFGAPPLFADREGEAVAKQFIKARLRAQSDDALKQLCDAVTAILDPDARLALDFRQFPIRSAALRAAVDDRFQTEFNAALLDLEKRLIDADTLSRTKAKEEAIRKEFVRKAVDLLCEKGEPQDLGRIRQVIASGFVDFSHLDADFLKKHGEWQDVSLLVSVYERPDPSLSLVSSLYDEDKLGPIAEAIHAIAKGRFGELSKSPMPARLLQRIIELATDKEIDDLDDRELLRLFGSEADDLRKAVLLRTVKALPKTRVRKLLAAYSEYDGSRYYSVFYWLDLAVSLTRKQVLHAVEVTDIKRR